MRLHNSIDAPWDQDEFPFVYMPRVGSSFYCSEFEILRFLRDRVKVKWKNGCVSEIQQMHYDLIEPVREFRNRHSKYFRSLNGV